MPPDTKAPGPGLSAYAAAPSAPNPAEEERQRKLDAIAVAQKMAKQAHANVGNLRSAYSANQAYQENAGVQGRRQIHQLSGLAVAEGGNQGLRGNIAGAVDAAKQGQIATAGFEAQQAGIMGNLATDMATNVGQAEMGALEQDQNLIEREQQLAGATPEMQWAQTTDSLDTQMSASPYGWYDPTETKNEYVNKQVSIAVSKGLIPDTPEGRKKAGDYIRNQIGG